MIRGYGMTTSEQATEHTCGACGGSGRTDKPHQIGGSSFYGGWIRAGGYESPTSALVICHVCLGAGRILDRMPAADALADAETLAVFAAVYHFPQIKSLSSCWRRALNIQEIAQPDSGYDEHRAVLQAHWLARAAFRAVPGLRG